MQRVPFQQINRLIAVNEGENVEEFRESFCGHEEQELCEHS